MKAVLNGQEMKEFDARSIKGYGIPSLVLMERAEKRRGRDRLVRLRLWK